MKTEAKIPLDRYFKLTDAAKNAVKALNDAAYSARTSRDRETFKDAQIALESALDAAWDDAELINAKGE